MFWLLALNIFRAAYWLEYFEVSIKVYHKIRPQSLLFVQFLRMSFVLLEKLSRGLTVVIGLIFVG